jgi:hypothetical protein
MLSSQSAAGRRGLVASFGRSENLVVALTAVAAVLLPTGFGTAQAAVRYVPADYATIQAAIDAATDGDSVLIAPGTYSGDGYTNVLLRGKRLVISDQDPNAETLINGADTGRAFILQQGEPQGTQIMQLTFVQCRAVGAGDGGAIIVSDATVTIDRCVFRQDKAGRGGAVWVERGSAEISDCFFEANVADLGGAVGVADASVKIAGSVFYLNWGVSVGGTLWAERSQLASEQCTFVNNIANQTGSVLGAAAQSLVTMSRSLVAGNLQSAPFACNSSNILVSCTDSWGNNGGDWGECLSDQTGRNGNISVNPLLCGPDENPESPLTLKPGSPCLPGNHPDGVDCELIGALGVGCNLPTAVQQRSWGEIKELFR